MESYPRLRRPSTSRKEEVIDQVCEKVLEDRHLTIQEIAAEVGISTGSVHSILTENWNLRICPETADGATEGTLEGNFLRTCSILQIMTQNLLRPSSLVMRPGFMVIT